VAGFEHLGIWRGPNAAQEVEELYEFIQHEEYTVRTEQTFHLLGMLDVGADLVAPLSQMRWKFTRGAKQKGERWDL
jgi:hypothetical protein